MNKKIIGYKCLKCKTVHYPNRAICKKCRNDEFEAVGLPDSGKLLTFTHLHNPAGDFEVPVLDLGIVELDNGCRITAQLNIVNPKIGMKVKGKIEAVRKLDYHTYEGMVFYKK